MVRRTKPEDEEPPKRRRKKTDDIPKSLLPREPVPPPTRPLPGEHRGKIPGTAPFRYTPDNVEKVLNIVREGWSLAKAARTCNVRYETLQWWKTEHEEFGTALKLARKEGNAYLEDVARERGCEGTDEPIYQGGELVGYRTRHSDALLSQQLEARMPERYKRNLKVEGLPGGGGTVNNVLIIANAQDSVSAVRAYKQLMKGDGSKD